MVLAHTEHGAITVRFPQQPRKNKILEKELTYDRNRASKKKCQPRVRLDRRAARHAAADHRLRRRLHHPDGPRQLSRRPARCGLRLPLGGSDGHGYFYQVCPGLPSRADLRRSATRLRPRRNEGRHAHSRPRLLPSCKISGHFCSSGSASAGCWVSPICTFAGPAWVLSAGLWALFVLPTLLLNFVAPERYTIEPLQHLQGLGLTLVLGLIYGWLGRRTQARAAVA